MDLLGYGSSIAADTAKAKIRDVIFDIEAMHNKWKMLWCNEKSYRFE